MVRVLRAVLSGNEHCVSLLQDKTEDKAEEQKA